MPEDDIVIVLGEPKNEKMAESGSRFRCMLWLLAVAAFVIFFVSIPAAYRSQAGYTLAMRRLEPPIQVYTPAQATRAAKAAVAQLQLIEQRRPIAASAANPLALPKTKETDLSSERRR